MPRSYKQDRNELVEPMAKKAAEDEKQDPGREEVPPAGAGEKT